MEENVLGAKKVFLINTHLNNIINAPDVLIHRLRYLFSLFKGRMECVVLWRPHPLSVSTIKAMNPVLYQSYIELIDEFKKLPNGIYDDSPDLHRSIACSDAYIGDYSSLVGLYVLSEKPMLIIQPLDKDDLVSERSIRFNTGFKKDNWFYLSAFHFNGFFRINLETGEMFYLGKFLEEEEDGIYLHSRSYVWKNFGWFIPSCGDYITKINLDNMTMSTISVGQITKAMGSFGSIVADTPYLWLIPIDGDSILRLNMETEEIKEYSEWPKEILYKPGRMDFYNGIKLENYLVLCPFNSNHIVVMDCLEGSMESYLFPYPMQSFHDMAYRDGAIWFCPYKFDKVVKWDINTRQFEEMALPFEDVGLPETKYTEFMYSSEALYLRPSSLGSLPILKIETSSGIIKVVDKIKLEGFQEKCNINGEIIDGRLWLYSPYLNGLLEIDVDRGMLAKHSLTVSHDFYGLCVPKAMKWKLRNNNAHGFLSDFYLNYEEFIDFVCKSNETSGIHDKAEIKNDMTYTDGMTGKRVWNVVDEVLEEKNCEFD